MENLELDKLPDFCETVSDVVSTDCYSDNHGTIGSQKSELDENINNCANMYEEQASIKPLAQLPQSPSLHTDYELSLYGMKLMVNRGVGEAKEFFHKYRYESPLMHSGYSFMIFMKSMISFEDLDVAMKALRDTEELCEKKEAFTYTLLTSLPSNQNDFLLEDKLQREIIIADMQLYQALLTSANQDLKSFVKAGWLLRKAWKHYDKTYKQITSLNADPDSRATSKSDRKQTGRLSAAVARRLLAAVCFGYGCFQLGLSLIPPKVLRIIEFLGFEADRNVALKCIEQTANSPDMKAPLALLTVLWYHTYVRHFFAIDGADFTAGIAEAEELISRHGDDYADSAMFIFVRARVMRIKKQTRAALETYEKAMDAHSDQVELKYLCMFEMAWLNLTAFEWQKALDLFNVLLAETKWSKCYYQYMVALCFGCLGDVQEAHRCFLAVPALMRRKNNQIEQFVTKRSLMFTNECPTQDHALLLVLEIIYVWRAIPTCDDGQIHSMLAVCDLQSQKQVLPLKCLIEGALHKELGQSNEAIQYLKEALARYSGPKSDLHIVAFAKYELATLYIQHTQTESEAKRLLMQIKDMGDFPFDQRLSVCVVNALKQLANKTK